jgi:predicted acetyltransferase
MWALIGSFATQARTVRAWLPPTDPVEWLLAAADARQTTVQSWALRVADAAAALTARGFPATARVSTPLLIDDRTMPANNGRWRLTVADGRGRLDRDDDSNGTEPLTVAARGLAALYAGVPMSVLRLTGLVWAGDPGHDAALESAFAAQPFALDAF